VACSAGDTTSPPETAGDLTSRKRAGPLPRPELADLTTTDWRTVGREVRLRRPHDGLQVVLRLRDVRHCSPGVLPRPSAGDVRRQCQLRDLALIAGKRTDLIDQVRHVLTLRRDRCMVIER